MKKILLFIFLFTSVCVQAQIESVIPPKPSPADGLVVDQTNTLTPEQIHVLKLKLAAYDKNTSNQIVVVLIPTLKGHSIEEVGLEMGRKWGVGGRAESDNGVVILIAKNDRKIRIEVGYGLEGAITDNTASSIIENNIKPNFRADNYYRGIDEAIDKIIEAAAGRYTAPKGYGKGKGLKGWQIFLAIIILWIIISAISKGGKGGGGYASRRGYRGLSGPFWWGTGSGWSGGGGGGWSGGGGSSGGFGGFGGGSFGGGGASGSW
jgi:uncharacterized protein